MIEKLLREDIEHLLKRFRIQCEKAGIVQDFRKHEYFIAPSEKRHAKKMEIKRKLRVAKLKAQKQRRRK